tara:strand:+ start:548 stop:1015 length:468 start_codon:yes stop_codon:yes gene_type:complete
MNNIELFEKIKDMAKDELKEKKSHLLTFILLGEKLEVVGMPKVDDKNKPAFLEMIRKRLKDSKANAYITINEGWFLEGESAKSYKFNERIRNYPTKKEALIINLIEKEGRKIGYFIPFVNENNEITFLEETKIDNKEKSIGMSGLFTELFENNKG